jgi:hypothetical protein
VTLAIARSGTAQFAPAPLFENNDRAASSASSLTNGSTADSIGDVSHLTTIGITLPDANALLLTVPRHTQPHVVSSRPALFGDQQQLRAMELLIANTESWRSGRRDHYTAHRFGSNGDTTLSVGLKPDELARELAFESLENCSELRQTR